MSLAGRLCDGAGRGGPIALLKDLDKYRNYITGLELTDYRVKVLNSGTQAVIRLLIESIDENGGRWTTIGASPNIIDASFQALTDSVSINW